MDGLSIRFVFDRKGETKKDASKKALVQIEVYDKITRKKVYISTGIKLLKSQHSQSAGFSIVSHPNATILKKKAYNIYNKIEAFINSPKCNSIDDVKNYDNSKAASQLIIDFIEEQHRIEAPDDTHSDYTSFLTRFKEYGKIQHFRDLTYENIEGFDAHLKKTIISQPTIYKRHSKLKHFIVIAKKKGLCSYNPYDDFIVKKGKHKDPKFLVEEQINKLLKYDASKSGMEIMPTVKDLFVFQCFTGMPYRDMQEFREEDIFLTNGFKTIRSSRVKTDESFVSLLLPEAERIAEKYNYSLPKMQLYEYNRCLKTLAAGAGINIPLSSHMARHTFATYLINKDIPVESISKALGHTNTKQTLRYAHLLGKKVINDMKKILEEDES